MGSATSRIGRKLPKRTQVPSLGAKTPRTAEQQQASEGKSEGWRVALSSFPPDFLQQISNQKRCPRPSFLSQSEPIGSCSSRSQNASNPPSQFVDNRKSFDLLLKGQLVAGYRRIRKAIRVRNVEPPAGKESPSITVTY
jgi:hypothetical protein